jgi:hypothetical protein
MRNSQTLLFTKNARFIYQEVNCGIHWLTLAMQTRLAIGLTCASFTINAMMLPK